MDTIDKNPLFVRCSNRSDIWLTAATVWEIGIRGLTGFRDKIAELLNSEHLYCVKRRGKSFTGSRLGDGTRNAYHYRKGYLP